MGTEIVIMLIIFHWVADFLMQDVDWANEKSISMHALLMHTVTYTLVFMLLMIMSLFFTEDNLSAVDPIINVLIFGGITFVCHTLTDYITSRIVKRKFDKGQYGTHVPNVGGFTVIGIDQILHYLQIFVAYDLIFM